MSRATENEALGAAIRALTEEWDQEAYADCEPDPDYAPDAQWPSACDFIEQAFALRNDICGPTEARQRVEGTK